jgi:hypothetical protein
MQCTWPMGPSESHWKKMSSAKLSLNRDLSLNKVSLNRDCTVLNMYVAVGIARYNMQKD